MTKNWKSLNNNKTLWTKNWINGNNVVKTWKNNRQWCKMNMVRKLNLINLNWNNLKIKIDLLKNNWNKKKNLLMKYLLQKKMTTYLKNNSLKLKQNWLALKVNFIKLKILFNRLITKIWDCYNNKLQMLKNWEIIKNNKRNFIKSSLMI